MRRAITGLVMTRVRAPFPELGSELLPYATEVRVEMGWCHGARVRSA